MRARIRDAGRLDDALQQAEQAQTYPHLVADLRELLEMVELEYRAKGGKVIIVIDELDKIGTAEDAERVSPSTCSTKIRCSQETDPQKKRRTSRSTDTGRPHTANSRKTRRYRL